MTSPYTAVNEVRTTHTPGPWEVVGPYFDIYTADRGYPSYICQSSKSQGDRREANARLIAAAPELLAELKRMHEHFSAFAADHSTEASTETWAALHCAKAAIASAESSS